MRHLYGGRPNENPPEADRGGLSGALGYLSGLLKTRAPPWKHMGVPKGSCGAYSGCQLFANATIAASRVAAYLIERALDEAQSRQFRLIG